MRPSFGGCDMLVDCLYAVGVVGVGLYMLAALVRPERF
jgi:hypothetical protein